MDELLPFYERELGIFRHQTREFAARYPKTAGNLLIAGDSCEDPHVERLIQSFALLTARVHKRLDDDYPQLTESLLETLLPHYLRPFPSCSIARIGRGAAPGEPLHLPRGTAMRSQPVRGISCQFRSVYPVTLGAAAVFKAGYDPIIAPPPAVRLADGVSSLLSFTLDCGIDAAFSPATPVLRLFIDGEPSFRAALLDTLFMRTASAYLQPDGSAAWLPLPRVPLSPVGYRDDEALIAFPVRAHPAFRLLTEYFAFSEKFNFIDIDLPALAAALPQDCRRFTLQLAIRGVHADSAVARVLGGLSADRLLPGCTPVVNLFERPGVPVKLTHTSADYPLLADAAQPAGYDIHSVHSAQVIRKSRSGEVISTFLPLYSNALGAAEHGAGSGKANYWLLRRDAELAAASPGHEYRIALIDAEFAPDHQADGTLSTRLTCSNRDLPVSLGYGHPEGDLQSGGVPSAIPIHLLRRPTAPHRFAGDAGAHWRLIAHLALDYANLTCAGLGEFRKMLGLYDLPRSAVSQRQIGGITGLEHGSTRAWIKTLPCATLMPGVAIRLTIDEQAFVGSGVFAFAQVIDHYFALNRQLNCFTQLTIVSQQTGEELLSCPPRTAEPSRA